MSRTIEDQPLNAPFPEAPYFTPAHLTSPGTPFPSSTSSSSSPARIPTLFTPLPIRSLTLRNRILVAPMCQYSTAPTGPSAGALTDYHIATLGHYALKGASIVFVEATGVQPNGRISPNCPGLWSDAQIEPLRRVADFIKSQGALVGIQLAHAGRKASTVAPWVGAEYRKRKGWGAGSVRATKEVGGWPGEVVGPMGGEAESWDASQEADEKGGYWPPKALSEEDIHQLVKDWGRAARRAVKAGVQVIEVHGAHGYLVHQFLSPVTNRRTDRYGGSFDNRTRLLREIVHEIRANIPEDMPLFVRVSSTEWLESTDVAKTLADGRSWDVEETLRLAALLPDWGVDLLDVSSGGNHPAQKVEMFKSKDYQIKIADRIRKEMRAQGKKLLIGAVGLITEAEQARGIVEEEDGEESLGEEARAAVAMTEEVKGKEAMADVVLVARQFMREPEWVLRVAHQLGVDVAWPNQFLRVRFPKL